MGVSVSVFYIFPSQYCKLAYNIQIYTIRIYTYDN